MSVLVAPDKFKGSLTASEVADCISDGLSRANVRSYQLPLADGGDGSVDSAIWVGFKEMPVTVSDALGQSHRSRIAERGGTVVVEVANTCGLANLAGRQHLPLDASSFGLGEAVLGALRLRPRRLVLALGGSASTDGGMGLLSALGFRFRDANGRELPACGRSLAHVAIVDASQAIQFAGVELVIATDVTTPLIGSDGAAFVYGPQKGASTAELALLNAGLENFVAAFVRAGYLSAAGLANNAGAGAAGGVGFAGMILGARTTAGADYFLDLLEFDTLVDSCHLVITGEGSIDDQTALGKLPATVARRSSPIPVYAVAGRSTLPKSHWPTVGFAKVFTLDAYTDDDTATDRGLTRHVLSDIACQIGQALSTPTLSTNARRSAGVRLPP